METSLARDTYNNRTKQGKEERVSRTRLYPSYAFSWRRFALTSHSVLGIMLLDIQYQSIWP